MNQAPRYPAARAANLALGMALVASVLLVGAGILSLRQGAASGWLLIGSGVLPALFGVLVWLRVRRDSEGRPAGDDPDGK
jgi:Na+/proline symporter